MKYDQEYIYTLLLRKQLGEVNEVEEKLLQKVMETDEQVRNCWFEQEEARRYTFNAILDDFRTEHDWCKVVAVIEPKPLHKKVLHFLKKYGAVAAAFIAAFVVATTYHHPRNGGNPSPIKLAGINPHFPDFPVLQSEDSLVTDTLTKLVAAHIERNQPDSDNTVEWNTLTVPPQTDYHLELADGTDVHLNASSTLRFPYIFSGNTREVYLEGEAFFTVTHDPSHPFIVHTGTASVIALGTSFNVNSYDSRMMTTSLVQGTVVTDVGDSVDVTLKPGFEAIYRPGEPFRVKRFDETVTLGWRDGIYRFVNRPLEDIGPVVMRWFGLKLEFATPAIAQAVFSANLAKDKPLISFLNDVSKGLNLDYKVYDGTIHFTSHNSAQDISF